MFQVKVTETNGKQWNFDLVGDSQFEVWTSMTGNDGEWQNFPTIPVHEAMVQIAVLMGNALRNQ
jgi:hypothetical protein